MTIHKPPENLTEMFRLGSARATPEWLPDATGPILNLGAGNKFLRGGLHLDFPDWNADTQPIPFPDEFFVSVYAMHFLEHVKDPRAVLREIQRVLVPGGHLNVVVPYYSSQIAFHDLDHKSFWCEETWKNLFAQEYYAKGHDGWKFRIGANYIMGIVERNLMLFTQLIRTPD